MARSHAVWHPKLDCRLSNRIHQRPDGLGTIVSYVKLMFSQWSEWDSLGKLLYMSKIMAIHVVKRELCFLAAGSSSRCIVDKSDEEITASFHLLNHWGWVTCICVGKLTIIGSDNGLSPAQHETIIWTNARILLIVPLGSHFSELLIKIHTFSFKKMHLKILSGKWRPFCFGLNVLNQVSL